MWTIFKVFIFYIFASVFAFFFFFFFFGRGVCGILVAQPGIEPTPPALERGRLHHWTVREVPGDFRGLCDQVT